MITKRIINVTLLFEGTGDRFPTSWKVLDAPQLRLRSPWLSWLSDSGGLLDPTSFEAGKFEVTLSLQLDAFGLRERPQPYIERVPIWAGSESDPELQTTLPLVVSLTVQATTSFIVWGILEPSETCFNRTTGHGSLSSLEMSLDQQPLLATFTACDADGLAVDHRLPNEDDSRAFLARIGHSAQTIDYVGDGRYYISMQLRTYGPFILEVELGELVFSLAGVSNCGLIKLEMEDGSCGCPVDSEPRESTCVACLAGQYKPAVGNGVCVDRPAEIWPFLVAGAAVIAVLLVFFSLHTYHERRRWRREVELERNFMAITCATSSLSHGRLDHSAIDVEQQLDLAAK